MEYEEILKRMLEKVPDDIDKREGSIIYNALAPAALELATLYFKMSNNIDLLFADTAVDVYLDRLCEQVGMSRKKATYSIRKGLFYNADNELMDIEIGTRYSANSIVFVVTEKIETGTYKLKCETAGTEGNNYSGDLVPIQYIQGLARVELTDILIPGEDIENDENLRKRYFENINETVFAGNIADYKIKTKEIAGVGAVKVTPVWNGGGTVKLTILDSDYNKATDNLIQLVQTTICPDLTDTGIGLAPIGHKVTVDTVENLSINLNTSLTLVENTNSETLKEKVKEVLNDYFSDLRKNWEEVDKTIVRISQIESKILNLDEVLDIDNTTINESTANLEIDTTQIPILGEVVIT